MWAAPMNCLDSRKLSCRRHQTFDLRTLTKAYQERLSALGVEYHNKLNKNNMMAGNIKSKYEPLQTWFVKYFHVKATSWIGFLQVCSISPAEQCDNVFFNFIWQTWSPQRKKTPAASRDTHFQQVALLSKLPLLSLYVAILDFYTCSYKPLYIFTFHSLQVTQAGMYESSLEVTKSESNNSG